MSRVERETVVALIEAGEQLDRAIEVVLGLKTLLAPESKSSLKDDFPAIRGALVLVHQSVLHANALIHSILEQGR